MKRTPAIMIVLILGVTSCIIPRAPGQSEGAFAVSRARAACVDEGKRRGFDKVEVLSHIEGGGTAEVGWTILVRLRLHRGDTSDETTCSYDTRTERAYIPR